MRDSEKALVISESQLYQLIDTVLEEYKEKFDEAKEPEFIDAKEAMKLLGIKSSMLQKFRDEDLIIFTQPRKKIILYQRESILEFLRAHQNR